MSGSRDSHPSNITTGGAASIVLETVKTNIDEETHQYRTIVLRWNQTEEAAPSVAVFDGWVPRT